MTFNSKLKQAKELIKKYTDYYGDKCIVANSFGKDSMVLYDIIHSVKPDIQCFTVQPPYWFEETIKFAKKAKSHYKMNLKIIKREKRKDKPSWWKYEPHECCNYYKVEPTKEILKKYNCWFSGLRRDEGATRATMEFVVDPDRFSRVKVNPILFFTEKDIWRYSALYNVPQNPLYKLGYRSLGCEPCSHIEKSEDEGERDGRWKGTKKCGGECGIHSPCQG